MQPLHEAETTADLQNDPIDALRGDLKTHSIYDRLETVEDLRFFMERHVVCVWDFMSLLKSLQAGLTCVGWPWTPPEHPEAARLINEIVLGEESDAIATGLYRSHFEWYLDAMTEVGADRGPMERLVASLRGGAHWTSALRGSGLPKEARDFAVTTMRLAAGPLHVRAAAFFHGREAVIPTMFIELVQRLRRDGHPCETLNAYLERHIEVDGGDHGPMAERLLEALVDGRPERTREAHAAGVMSLRARKKLWTQIGEGLDRRDQPEAKGSKLRSFFQLR